MRKILIVLAVIGVVGVVGSLLLNYLSAELARESKIFVEEKIPLILGSWNAELLIKHASPELLQTVPPPKIRESIQAFSFNFGKLKKYHGSTGQIGLNLENNQWSITATFTAKADFTTRSATVFIQLIRHGEEWKILAFNVK